MKKTTFGKWLNDWFIVYKKPYVKSYHNIEIIMRLHIPQGLKSLPLEEISAFDIQKALNSVKQSRTRLDVFNVYHGSLEMAFKLGLIEKNIADLLIKPKHDRKIGSALNLEELQAFLQAIEDHRLKPFFLFLLYSGCRRSEALNLQWQDIDRENKVIAVHGTKTATSDRIIPLLPDCEKILDSIKQRGKKVFNHRADYVSKAFKKICPNHKLHDLRHTFATRCLECGISLKVVQKWLGHSRLETTASIYTHIQENFVKTEAQKFKLT